MNTPEIEQLEGEKRPNQARWEVWRPDLGEKGIAGAAEGREP